jgi:hypothetical protein
MPDQSNSTPKEVPSSERDDGGDCHSGLPFTKLRGFPESPRGNTRVRLRENPDRNRVNSSSRLMHFASSPICDRRAILIERNIVAGFPSSAHSAAGRFAPGSVTEEKPTLTVGPRSISTIDFV